ncbi:MAG TPA: complex I NDUFA9 subunit family protein [Caulobacteraceae bacterium]|jgi:NADH dehydrogenase
MQGLVTVFGGSGFIGRVLVRALAKRGLRVRVTARRVNVADQMRLYGDVGQIQVQQANLRMPDSVERALEGAEACVNLVGLLFERGRQRFEAVHAGGAETVARACAARGVRTLVQMSALGAGAGSSAAYARTKAEGEAAARRHMPDAIVVRPSIVFGQGDGFFNKFAAMATVSPVLPLVGGGKTRFQPVYVGDVASAIGNALIDPAALGRTFELGGPHAYSFRELLELTLREVRRSRLLVPVPFPLAKAIGFAGEVQSAVLPFFPPVLTRDQVELLRADNVPSGEHPGLAELGVQPTAVEAIVPTYLYRYRTGGQFSEPTAMVEGSRL